MSGANDKSLVVRSFSISSSWIYEDKSFEERKYLSKLDFYLLSSAMLGYFIKNLNAKNLSTLYLNGMADYYDMEKNEFNLMQSSFFIGYLLGGFPSKFLLTHFKARYYLGFLELTWGCLTLLMCFCQSINQVYALRFTIGFLELGFFPSMVFIIGSFYNDAEINKRQLLFAVSGTIATIITGPLQQLILSKDLSVGGLEKFQILFLCDAIISLPIAIYTMLVNPGLPSQLDVWYFDDEDKEILKERSFRNSPPVKTRKRSLKDFCNSWHIIVFPLLFAFIQNTSFACEQIIATSWIKYDLKLPSAYYNYFPSVVNVGSIITTLAVSVTNDRFHGTLTSKLLYLYFALFLSCSLLLAYWKIPLLLHWLCYIILGVVSWASPQMFSWLNRTLSGDDEKRHFAVVLTNSFDYLIYAIYPIWAWDTRYKPYFRRGFICTIILSIVGIAVVWLTNHLINRDSVRNSTGGTTVDEETLLLEQENIF